MKKSATAVFLMAMLSISTAAGEIPTSGITAPSPPGTQTTSSSEPGNIPTDGSSYEITGTALELIQMFLGVGV